MSIELPFPPSINHYWRHVGYKTLISKAGRQYRQDVVTLLKLLRFKKLDGDLDMDIGLYLPDRRRRDVDNVLKSLLDSLQAAGAYEDDAQIVKLTVEKRGVCPGGKAVVTLTQRVA